MFGDCENMIDIRDMLYEVNQHNVIFDSLEGVINLDVNVSELKDSTYLSSVK